MVIISSMVNLGFSFVLTTFSVPLLLIAYVVMTWTRKCWIRFVKWKYPSYIVVEENSIRSILDQGRNPGICTLLVQGRSIVKGVRNHLIHLTSTRKFLKSALFTRWGEYVWKELDYFSVDNHLYVNSPYSFRGRPITENNIQDYISDVTSKFLPKKLPPWQVHVVNCFVRGEEHQICLVRAHHLLLRQEHLTLADFLPLKYSMDNWTCQESDSPFTNLYIQPSALPRLRQMLIESFSNCWNDFLYNNDPNERPEILKKHIGVFQCVKIATIVLVCTLKELARQCRKSEGLKFLELLSIVRRESRKRNFNSRLIYDSIVKSFNPIDIFYKCIATIWYIITSFLKMPLLLVRELRALQSRHKHCYPDSLMYMLSCYLPLMFQAIRETMSISWIAITAPKIIIEELLLKNPQSNRLQTISPCGRKVVAWSEEIDVELVRKMANVTGAMEMEILLTATVDALKEYFRHSAVNIPDDVFATVKYVSQRAVFLRNHEARGILCIALPTRTPLFHDDLIEILQVIQRNVQDARSQQSAIYAITAAETSCGLISSCIPSIVLKLFLNQLSKRYSLCLTHVDGDLPVEGIDGVIYWRPPQGNCNMSMTLHRHGNGIRLGVMGDALIGPHHFIIARAFPESIRNLASILGVPRASSRNPSPNPLNPTTSPGY